MDEGKRMRAIRGATTVEVDTAPAILDATRELLQLMLERNALISDDVISAIFTLTGDLHAAFPAQAARELGWHDVPLLCATGADVEGTLPRCIRVMLHVEAAAPRASIRHVYLGHARALRPDLEE